MADAYERDQAAWDLGHSGKPLLKAFEGNYRKADQYGGLLFLSAVVYRFLGGTPSIPSLYAAREGVRIVSQVGPDAVRRKSLRQTSLIIELSLEEGVVVNTPRDPEQRGATVAVDCPHASAIAEALIQRGFLVDYRPSVGIRVAPHFYNSDAECEAVIREIASLRDEGV